MRPALLSTWTLYMHLKDLLSHERIKNKTANIRIPLRKSMVQQHLEYSEHSPFRKDILELARVQKRAAKIIKSLETLPRLGVDWINSWWLRLLSHDDAYVPMPLLEATCL